MRFRKKDYIIFYLITVIIYAINIMSPVKMHVAVALMITAIFPALLLGTITNFLFKKR